MRIGDGITEQTLAEGIWTSDAEDDEHLGSVRTDDGATFVVPDGSMVDVITALPRATPAVLTRDELYVAAELADELAAVYDGEPLGAVAAELSRRISDACGFTGPQD